MANKRKAVILSSFLALTGIVGTSLTLVGCNEEAPQVTRYTINTNIDNVKDIKVKYSSEAGANGETITGTLTYDEAKFKIVSVTELSGVKVHIIDGNKFKFIMPAHEVTLVIKSERIIEKQNLLEALQTVKDARNYSVHTEIETKSDVADAFCYFTENAYMKQLTQVDPETGSIDPKGTSITGEINHADGVYQYIMDPTTGRIDTSKVIYESVKEGYNSFWDPKHNVTGLHELNLQYVKAKDVAYTFKPAEIGNINAVFENTFISYEVVKKYNPVIVAEVNNRNKLQFTITMAGYGTIKQEIDLIGETTIPYIDEFLQNGGGPQKSVLTKEQEKTLEAVKGNNYIQSMGSILAPGDVKIERGKVYYTENYMYTDYTDEFIEFAASQEIEVFDNGYIQDGNDVVQFKVNETAEGQQIELLEITREKNTTVPVSQKYISQIKYFDIYKHAQTVSYPVGQNRYLTYDEIADREIVQDFAIKALRLDVNDFNHLVLLDSIQTCGVQPLVDDYIQFLVFAVVRNPETQIDEPQFFGTEFNSFGKAKVQLIEDYLNRK